MSFSTLRLLFVCVGFSLGYVVLHAVPTVSLETDKESALYQRGEEAVFTLRITEEDELLKEGSVHVRLGVATGKTLIDKEYDLSKENPIRFSGTLEEPGFLLATVSGIPEVKTVYAGAGFDPEKIEAVNQLPQDFMEFWNSGREQIQDAPVVLEKLEQYSSKEYTSYQVIVDVLHGEKLYGFLSVPNREGRFPILVTVPGAGPGVVAPETYWAKKGVIFLVMNVHKYPVVIGDREANQELYKQRSKEIYYPRDHADDRDRYHFRNVILGVDRAINELVKRPDWDGEHLVMRGSSQGGGMSLIMGGLNSHVTAISASVPALCDHRGHEAGRKAGWPGLASLGEKALNVSSYYDVANFARFIRCPVLVSAGFIDNTCSPASVYAAWNHISVEGKRIFAMPRTGHSTSKTFANESNQWVNQYLGF